VELFKALLVSACTGLAIAQSSSVTGTVTDPSGAAVPGIVVSIGNRRTPARDAATDEKGMFRFSGLKPGTYDVKIAQPPFDPVSVPVRIDPAAPTAPLRIVLKLAEVRDTVTVTERVSEISTSPADNTSALSIGSEELQVLPVLGSDYVSLLGELVGGAGADPGGTTVVVDGVEMDARSVPVEAIQQVRINRDPYTAEFQRPGRGRIEITTRDAATDFHGSLRMSLRNSAFDARNAFAPDRPDEKRHILAGYLTGPLDRSGKISFMVAGEFEDENLQSLVYARTPQGLFNQQVRTPQTSSDLMVKLRRLAGEKHIFNFRFDREKLTADNQGVGGFRLPEAGYNNSMNENSWRMQHTAFLSVNLISDLSLEWETTRSRTASVLGGQRLLTVADAFVSGGAQMDERANEKEGTSSAAGSMFRIGTGRRIRIWEIATVRFSSLASMIFAPDGRLRSHSR
jgi:hypothetical protein